MDYAMSDPISQCALAALRDVDFDWTSPLQGIWHDPSYHVEDLHKEVVDDLIGYFTGNTDGPLSPLGQVIAGPAGVGKTHLIGQLRRRAWESKGWFVLLDIVGIKDFWPTTALCFLTSVLQPMPNGRPQYEAALSTILRRFANDPKTRQADAGDLIISLLRRVDAGKALAHADVVRACCSSVPTTLTAQVWRTLGCRVSRSTKLGARHSDSLMHNHRLSKSFAACLGS
jgi:hypothetical protein